MHGYRDLKLTCCRCNVSLKSSSVCCMTERHTGTNLFPTMVQSDICNVGYKDSSVFDTFAGKHCNKRGSRIVNSSGQIREPLLKSVGTIIHFATVVFSIAGDDRQDGRS